MQTAFQEHMQRLLNPVVLQIQCGSCHKNVDSACGRVVDGAEILVPAWGLCRVMRSPLLLPRKPCLRRNTQHPHPHLPVLVGKLLVVLADKEYVCPHCSTIQRLDMDLEREKDVRFRATRIVYSSRLEFSRLQVCTGCSPGQAQGPEACGNGARA